MEVNKQKRFSFDGHSKAPVQVQFVKNIIRSRGTYL